MHFCCRCLLPYLLIVLLFPFLEIFLTLIYPLLLHHLHLLSPLLIELLSLSLASKDLVTEDLNCLEERIDKPMEIGQRCQVLCFFYYLSGTFGLLCLLDLVILLFLVWFVIVEALVLLEHLLNELDIFLLLYSEFSFHLGESLLKHLVLICSLLILHESVQSFLEVQHLTFQFIELPCS